MSGGLDSTSVAAAAAAGPRAGAGGGVRTFSWVFAELAEQDESRYIDEVVERHGLRSTRLQGDGDWPLRDLDSWFVNPNAPVRDLYRLRERAYRASRRAGAQVMLTGDFGDNLYCGYDFWLRDLLAEGRLADAGRGALRLLASACRGDRAQLKRLRHALTRALGWRGREPRPPQWLTRRAVDRLGGGELLPRASRARRPDQYRVLLDPVIAHGMNLEQGLANRMGVELRFPYRDRRLVQFVLSIPAHQIYRPGWLKWLLREAMRDLLPRPVRRRRDPTSLLPLCARGLVERERDSVAALLGRPDAIWPRYVRSEWLRAGFPERLRARELTLETVVAWRCICMELWRGRPASAGRPAGEPSLYNLSDLTAGQR